MLNHYFSDRSVGIVRKKGPIAAKCSDGSRNSYSKSVGSLNSTVSLMLP